MILLCFVSWVCGVIEACVSVGIVLGRVCFVLGGAGSGGVGIVSSGVGSGSELWVKVWSGDKISGGDTAFVGGGCGSEICISWPVFGMVGG